jgi:hypothetical protein
MQDFQIKLIKHLVRRSCSPIQVKIRSEHDSKCPEDWIVKAENSDDLNRKCWSLRNKEPYPNRGENDTKGSHAEGWKFQKTHEVSPTKEVVNWAGWAQAGWPSPLQGPFAAPFDLDDPQTIYGTHAKIHTSYHSSFAAEEQRREGHHSAKEMVEIVD